MTAAPAPDPHSPFEQLRLARQIVRTEGQTLLALADLARPSSRNKTALAPF